MPPKLTAVAPERLVPVIVTVAPKPAVAGEKEVIAGGAGVVKVNPASVPVPPGLVTETFPLAPDDTTAVMLVEDTILKDAAAVPPKLTAVAPEKLVPVIVTVAPDVAEVGVNELIVGAVGINVKPLAVPVPPAFVTETFPLAPAPTTAVMLVGDTTVKDAAAVPPKLTPVIPVKPLPLMVTVVPPAAEVGLYPKTAGAGGIKVNPADVTVPPGVVTETLPLAPVVPTKAVILVEVLTTNCEAATPPKLTAVVPVKLVPVMVICAVDPPEAGVKDVIVGAGGV